MATPQTARVPKPGRTLIVFAVAVALLYVIMAVAGTWAPRLGLDLRGGTTVTLTARQSGSSSVNAEGLERARTIIQNRVDSLGVGETSVSIQGDRDIEVAVPNIANDELVSLVGQTAQLAFRNVFYVVPVTQTDPSASAQPSSSASSQPSAGTNESAAPAPSASATATGEATASTAVSSARQRAVPALPTAPPTPRPSTPGANPKSGFDDLLAWQPSNQDIQELVSFECGDDFPDVWDQPLITCDQSGLEKYLLGPVLLRGERVTDAQALVPQGRLAWIVSLSFDAEGADQFSKATSYLSTQQAPMNQFAVVLDGEVIVAPSVETPIPGGSAEISGGGINAESSQELATILRFGALPITFDVASVDTVSASIGDEQLQAGIIAGIIGLILVLIYSFVYYRALSVIVVGSLVWAALITWAVMVLLGETVGFALNLPGVAGAIMAIGVTADSFVVYFERIRDEVRDGRSLQLAVETGWRKARGTIVIADAVQLLSAIVLFVLAIGAVKGFAFTLLITTIIDLLIVFFFTKPLVSLLARTAFFQSGHPMSGFDPAHLGVSLASLQGRRGSAAASRKAAAAASARNPESA